MCDWLIFEESSERCDQMDAASSIVLRGYDQRSLPPCHWFGVFSVSNSASYKNCVSLRTIAQGKEVKEK